MNNKISKTLYWAPRILGMIAILFISMFAFDVFENEYTILETIGALFMHLIPSFILTIILVIAWKYELIGGILFLIPPTVYIYFAVTNVQFLMALSWILIVGSPFFLTGTLFIIIGIKKRKKK